MRRERRLLLLPLLVSYSNLHLFLLLVCGVRKRMGYGITRSSKKNLSSFPGLFGLDFICFKTMAYEIFSENHKFFCDECDPFCDELRIKHVHLHCGN
jgi:hypothetical protein